MLNINDKDNKTNKMNNFSKYFSMPVERRHMVTVFLKNKLMLVGGVGRYRQKLQSIDIYDVHTGDFDCTATQCVFH